MNFQTAKRIVGMLMAISVISCIVGIAVFEPGSLQASYCVLGAFGALLLSVGVMLKWCRCPWCGKVIFRKLFYITECPSCRRDIETGKKKKGKGGKR